MPPLPSSSKVYHSLLTLSTAWPTDKLRPTLQFGIALKAATDRIFTGDAVAVLEGKGAQVAELESERIMKVQKMEDSLRRILADSALKEFPITNKTLEPVSFPKHYKRLRHGIAMAERGEVEDRGYFSWFKWKQD